MNASTKGQEVWFFNVEIAITGLSFHKNVGPSKVGSIIQETYQAHRYGEKPFLMGNKGKPIKKSYAGNNGSHTSRKEVPFFSTRKACVEAYNQEIDKAIADINSKIKHHKDCIKMMKSCKQDLQ